MRNRLFTDGEIEGFVQDGFIRLENTFPSETAAEAREMLWRETGCDAQDKATWTRPVIRLGNCPQEIFRKAANTPKLHAAHDDLVGAGRWIPRDGLGGFAIRFPHPDEPGDTGWHVDASFAPEEGVDSHLYWKINVWSKGRALLMLFLFTDVYENDAPTRIRLGSHLPVARLLAPAGDQGMTALDLGLSAADATAGMPETLATGKAGTVYLCHPFLLHAARPHRGSVPRFLAQPPLYPRGPLELMRTDGRHSPVERAVVLALGAEWNHEPDKCHGSR